MHGILATWLMLASSLGQAGESGEKLVRPPIAKEPAYAASEPLYCLLVFGSKAPTKVWAVLDKSQADGKHYDVVFVDLDADGDLTDEGERFTATPNPYGESHFKLADFADPTTGDKHTEFKLTISERRPSHLFSLRWRGKHKLGGGYPEIPDGGYMRFAARPADAPILRIDGDGPFRFQRWYLDDLRIGMAGDVKLFVGLPGEGKNAFFAFQEHVLPEKCGVRATLIYENQQGEKLEAESELLERC